MTLKSDKPLLASKAPGDADVPLTDWQALKLLNQYRLFLIMAMAAIYYLAESQRLLGERDALVFQMAHLGYGACVALFAFLIGQRRPAVDTQFYLHNYFDVVFIGLLIYASGGVQSGLGPLMLIAIALLSQLTSVRYALLFAAIATTVILAEELYARLHFGAWAADFERTAVLGSLLFATAWLMTVPLRRLLLRHLPQTMAPVASLDVEAMATLNEEIIRELDSGVVMIDSANQVQLLNDKARSWLGAENAQIPMHVGRLSDTMFTSMQDAKSSGTLASRAFTVDSTGVSLLPHFIPLSAGGMLVKLDDHAQLRKQFQQLKLASLGRLSASIAHEIRNPLGALSHAVQLLEESESINHTDRDLLGIARRHSGRINRIVEDVLQLSQYQPVHRASIDLTEQVTQFRDRFCAERAMPVNNFLCQGDTGLLARFDPLHFDQVLWNLCSNAQLHNESADIAIEINCWVTRTGVAIVDIEDNGRGITPVEREQLFEPFYSTHQSGSGLGLFIIRELCELNNASIDCLESELGAHFRVSMLISEQMVA